MHTHTYTTQLLVLVFVVGSKIIYKLIEIA